MANITIANTSRQLSADDAAFLLDVLHHLEAPITVNVRQIASSRNSTPNAIHQRVFKIRHRHGINIQGGNGRTRDSPKSHRRRNVESSPDSNLREVDEIPRRATASPLTPEGVIRQSASVSTGDSPGKSRRGIGSGKGCWTKKITGPPDSTQQAEMDETSHMMDMTADGASVYVNDLKQLDE